MTQKIDWAKAISEMREPLPMEPEIWAAGADTDTAHFVARMLRERGYYLVRSDDLGWDDIRRYNEELRKVQDVYEDGGGFFVRCIMALFGKKADPVTNYQQAAQALLDGLE